MTGHHDHDRFDRTMRALHRESLAHLRPDTLHRLRGARAAAADAPARRFAWPIASAMAALLVLAVALPLLRPPVSSAPDRPDAQASRADAAGIAPATGQAPQATASSLADDEPVMLAALEESPDFYLWLASNDVAPAVLE